MRELLITVTGFSAVAGMLFLLASGVRTFDTAEASLYERLGGEAGVESVLDSFLASVADDKRLGIHFADIDMTWLRAFLVDWTCDIGGPCRSDGEGPAPTREGTSVTEDEFNLMTEHFADAMSEAGINAHDYFDAMYLFVDMRDAIGLR